MALRLSTLALTVVFSCALAVRSHAGPSAESEVDSINGRPFESVVASLRDLGRRQARTGAMMDIARYANRPEALLPEFKTALRDSDPVVRASAAQALGVFGQRKASFVKDFLPDLIAALDDANQLVKSATTIALGTIGPPAYDAAPRLRDLRKDASSRQIRQSALSAFVRVTRGSTEQQEVLLHALQQKEFPASTDWIAALDDSEGTIRLCRSLLRENDSPAYQLAASKRLARAGKSAVSASEDLIGILNQPIEYEDVFTRVRPGEALQHPRVFGRAPKSIHLRLTAAWALTEIGETSSRRLFATVEKRMSDEDADERLSAAVIVSRLCDRPGAKQLVAAMARLEQDEDVRVRTIARLGHLRLLHPGFQGQTDARFDNLPLPDDGEDWSDDAKLTSQLHADLDNLIVRLGKPMEAADAWALLCELVTPNDVESAIVQGHWLSQFERKRHGYRHFSETLKGIDRRNMELTGRTTVLGSPQTREALRFYYFDGHWKFAN